MDQVRLAFVQFGDFFAEVACVVINICRAGNMAGFEFVGCANIENDIRFIRAQLVELFNRNDSYVAGRLCGRGRCTLLVGANKSRRTDHWNG
jgi:hypothetical protein